MAGGGAEERVGEGDEEVIVRLEEWVATRGLQVVEDGVPGRAGYKRAGDFRGWTV